MITKHVFFWTFNMVTTRECKVKEDTKYNEQRETAEHRVEPSNDETWRKFISKNSTNVANDKPPVSRENTQRNWLILKTFDIFVISILKTKFKTIFYDLHDWRTSFTEKQRRKSPPKLRFQESCVINCCFFFLLFLLLRDYCYIFHFQRRQKSAKIVFVIDFELGVSSEQTIRVDCLDTNLDCKEGQAWLEVVA